MLTRIIAIEVSKSSGQSRMKNFLLSSSNIFYQIKTYKLMLYHRHYPRNLLFVHQKTSSKSMLTEDVFSSTFDCLTGGQKYEVNKKTGAVRCQHS